MAVADALERELERLPKDLAESALAASALAMARIVDDQKCSATSRTMAQARLQDALKQLRELAPAERKDNIVDELKARRRPRGIERRPGAPA